MRAAATVKEQGRGLLLSRANSVRPELGPMTRRINFASQMKTSGQRSWMTSGDLAVQKLTVTPWVASGLLTHQLKTPPNLSGFFRDCRATADSRAPPWLLSGW